MTRLVWTLPDGQQTARWAEDEGGSQPVSCVVARDNSFSVRTVGNHPILWDALYDNYNDFNPLAAIPAGLGLSFDFDGSSADIETTNSGVWAFTYTGLSLSTDDTWTGLLDTRFGGQSMPVRFMDAGATALSTVTLALPSGVTFGPQITVSTEATADPYTLTSAYLIATRLG